MNNEPKLWCGIDISKKSFDASIVTSQSVKAISSVPAQQFKQATQGIADFLSWAGGHCKKHGVSLNEVHIVLEATGKYSTNFFNELSAQREGLHISIVNPGHASHFQKSLGLRNKTDALDARALGFFARERKPEPYRPPSQHQQELAELYRQRSYYVRQRVAQEARLKEAFTETARKIEEEAIKDTKKTIKSIEKELQRLRKAESDAKRDIDLLMSIPGIGFITAVGVVGELGDLRRFEKATELASYAGLAPQFRESGTSVKAHPRISKAGNSVIRKSLYMSALTWTQRSNEGLGMFYARLVQKGKAKRSALLAVARKLLVLMRAVLISGKPYDETKGKPKFSQEPVENLMKKREKVGE